MPRGLRATTPASPGTGEAPCLNAGRLSRLAQPETRCPQSPHETRTARPSAPAQTTGRSRMPAVRCTATRSSTRCVLTVPACSLCLRGVRHTYIGCMQKVYEVEIDVDRCTRPRSTRGFGAVVGAEPRPCAGSRSKRPTATGDDLGCQPNSRAPARPPDVPRVRPGSLRGPSSDRLEPVTALRRRPVRARELRSLRISPASATPLPGVSITTGSPSKRGSDRNAMQPSSPISPSPRFAWRSRLEPSGASASFTWSARRRSMPIRSPSWPTSPSRSVRSVTS